MNGQHQSQNHTAPPISARRAGLRYTTDKGPGIRRVKAGTGFRYVRPSGRPLADEADLQRIRKLAIPPAWRDVWISPDPHSHLQATGRDARGRKQYRYHARWRDVRHETKFDRMVPFGRALPEIRDRIARDLRDPALTRTKVVAAVVQLLEKTLIRVGNEEYARTNGSFGLTTLRDRHVRVRGGRVQFQFKGKSGIKQVVQLSDARLAKIVKRCQELPGQELFQYLDDQGKRRKVTSADVNAYLRDVTGGDYTAKDFRTWAGTLLAADALCALAAERQAATSQRALKGIIVQAIETVAAHLGNTPAVCRGSYIHPAILAAHADGRLASFSQTRRRRLRGLSPSECALLALLSTRVSLREQLAASVRAINRAKQGRRRSARPTSPRTRRAVSIRSRRRASPRP
jgi:DNA topoisomerase I